MKRPFVLVGLLVALVGFGPVAQAGTAGNPVLRSVSETRGHVIATFTLGLDQIPGQLLVTTSRVRLTGWIPASRIALRESMRTSPDPATGVARWRTRKAVPAGTYYIAVSGVDTGGVTDCMPRRPTCLLRWSNVRRIVVP